MPSSMVGWGENEFCWQLGTSERLKHWFDSIPLLTRVERIIFSSVSASSLLAEMEDGWTKKNGDKRKGRAEQAENAPKRPVKGNQTIFSYEQFEYQIRFPRKKKSWS